MGTGPVIPRPPNPRSMITTRAHNSGWIVAQDNAACTAYADGTALVTILWTSDGDLFAGTRLGDGETIPELLGVVPCGDTAAAQAVVLGWLHRLDQTRPDVADLSTPPAVVTALDSAMREAMRA